MGDLIKAIQTNDLVKFKRIFNESMQAKIKTKLDEQRKRIAEGVVIEGEVNEAEDEAVKKSKESEDDDSDDDDDNDDED